MPRKKNELLGHTGSTLRGHTRDVKVERVGKITIYKRGDVYYLYYRQSGISQRRRIDGNLAVARATAHKVQGALDDGKPSPIAYSRTSPDKMVDGFLDAIENVQKLALRTQDRYRAALDRFLDFCRDAGIGTIETIQEATVEDFVKWLRGQKRVRNGALKGKRDYYKVGGVKFILSTCRTAFNWATRHRMLPPFAQNPFMLFPIDKLKDSADHVDGQKIFTPQQEKAFFDACNSWQLSVFTILATYGLRVGELTHLLIDDIDHANDVFVIRSKPWMLWTVKTGRERRLPLLAGTKEIIRQVIGDRKTGFVFVSEEFCAGRSPPSQNFTNAQSFKAHLEKIVADLQNTAPDIGERELKRAVVKFLRSIGQIPEKRVRSEFMELTNTIGCPEFTKVHDLRHLFSSRAQAAGVNPILVQEMLGHTTLDMTKRYTHLGMDTKRAALQSLATNNAGDPQAPNATSC